MKKLIVVLTILSIPILGKCITPTDTVRIKEVHVSTYKTILVNTSDNFDSARLSTADAQNLSRFLQENSSIQFKTYGTSGSSVMSIRGANSSHSKVVWNGLSIGSPMLNMNDVSLISASSADDLKLQKGGSTATNGNSALSGILSLKSSPKFGSEQIHLGINYSSLNNTDIQLKYTKGTRNFSSQTAISYINNKNNFTFKNRSELGNPIQEQLNSDWNQIAIIQSLFYRHKKFEIEWHQWFQESDRELSPAVYNRTRTNYQLDKSYRTVANYKRIFDANNQLTSSVSFTREQLRYVSRIHINSEDFILFNTRSYFDQLQYQSTWKYSFKRFVQDISLQYIFDGAYVEDYYQYRKRNKYSISSSSKYTFINSFYFDFSNRVEVVNSNVYYASSLDANFIRFSIYGIVPYIKISKNYNLPGLNDLYWVPGGNPNLDAEKSWEQNVGVSYQKQLKKFYVKSNLALYHSLVSDWILWQPSAIENGLWTPQNLKEVKLQGAEFELEIKFSINKNSEFKLKSFYAYTQAINNKSVNANDASVGKQLIYIPMEKSGVNLIYSYKGYQFSGNFHSVSHRYTTSDHSEFLPGYNLVDARIQKAFEIKSHNFITGIYVDNILNTIYESIPFQAMPARVFGINFKYQINNQKSNEK